MIFNWWGTITQAFNAITLSGQPEVYVDFHNQPSRSPQTFVPKSPSIQSSLKPNFAWMQEVLNQIGEIANYIKTNNSSLKHYAIFVRRAEPLSDVFKLMDDILMDSILYETPSPLLNTWVNEWKSFITLLKTLNTQRQIHLQRINLLNREDTKLLDQSRATDLARAKAAYSELTKEIRDQLAIARKKVEEQLASEDYKDEPYNNMLHYLAEYWEALVLFSLIPDIPLPKNLLPNTELPNILMDQQTISVDFTQLDRSASKNINDYESLLNVGTPAMIILHLDSNHKWHPEFKIAPELPGKGAEDQRLDEEVRARQVIDRIIQALREHQLLPPTAKSSRKTFERHSAPDSPAIPVS